MSITVYSLLNADGYHSHDTPSTCCCLPWGESMASLPVCAHFYSSPQFHEPPY